MKRQIVLVCLLVLVAGGVPTFAQDARAAYEDGLRAQGTEDYPLAVEKFKEALAANPSYAEPMEGLAQSFLLMGEYDEAYRYVAMALVHDRNNPAPVGRMISAVVSASGNACSISGSVITL